MTLDHIVATATLVSIVTTVALDIIVAFVIPLVVLLTSSPVTWRKGHLWNFSVLQRVHPSGFFYLLLRGEPGYVTEVCI
jgi:hypothetical protein